MIVLFTVMLATPVWAQTTLSNGQTLSSRSGATGSAAFYKISVPSGQSSLVIKTWGGSGDCDLYVKRGSQPTTSSFDYRPYLGGNDETVSVANPASGDWYVMLHGYSAFSGLSLQATYAAPVASRVATPAISPNGGTFTSAQSISLSCGTAGATIRYTVNGSEPSSSSAQYTGPISVASTMTVKAKAFKSGMTDSYVASASFTISAPAIVTLSNGQTLSSRSGATGSAAFYKISVPSGQSSLVIKTWGGTGDCDLYVKRGSQPTTSSYDYRPYLGGNDETVTVANPAAGDWYVMLHAYSAFSGLSLQATYAAPVASRVATPTFSPPGGTFTAAQSVTISCGTAGATIRYTLNGSDPTSTSAQYMGPIPVASTMTVKAKAFKSGMTDSYVASASFTISAPAIVTLSNGQTLSNRSGATGSAAYYKITVPAGQSSLVIKTWGGSGDCDLYVKRGSQPTTSSYDYRPYLGGNDETVTVANPAAGDWYVMLHGYSAFSGLSLQAAYSAPVVSRVATPVLSPNGGTFNSAQAVTISCDTSGATIRYTLNGSDPTSTSAQYMGPIPVASTTTIKAKAFKSGMTDSYVASASYAISQTPDELIGNFFRSSFLSGALGSERYYKITVPPGQAKIEFQIQGGSGDCDIYVKRGARPTTSSYDYRPYLAGNDETVTVNSPVAGDWYVMLRGYNAYNLTRLYIRYYVSSIVTGFDVSRDGFTFINTGNIIPDDSIWNFLDNSGGACLGMSAFAQYYYINAVKNVPSATHLADFCNNGSCPYIANINQMTAAINNLGVMLLSLTGWVSDESALNAVKINMSLQLNPVVIGMFTQSGPPGHAVLAYAAYETSTETIIYVYDPNLPADNTRRIIYNKTSKAGTYTSANGTYVSFNCFPVLALP